MTRPLPDSDEDLAAQAAGGSRSAFEELVKRHGGRVLAVLERRLGDHHLALDLTQEAWVRVYRALPVYDQSRSFRSWLFAIVLNGARDAQRQRGRSRLEFVETLPGQAQRPPAREQGEAIFEALALVPEPYRTAVVLVDVEQLAYEECAEVLGVALGTAKSRVSRGRQIFRDAFTRLEGKPTQGVSAEAQT